MLFGPAREAAGLGSDDVTGDTVATVLASAVERYGPAFEQVLIHSQVWVNGELADRSDPTGPYDEVAVLPPISGG